ncbi:MAG: Beta-lactamase protein [uncultured bacterium]|nr:MAG: Beta-lactamase protein [uncultured bacterium]HBR71303.1 hypothetical protein [Candidatus Moranbacteria bacterium]
MQKNKDVLAILIGLILIIIVTAIIFTKSKDKVNTRLQKTEVVEKNPYQSISPTELQQKIRSKGQIKIIDTRSFSEYSYEHIMDSSNISLDEIEKYSLEMEPEIILIIDDTTGDSLDKFISNLKSKGAKEVFILSGGMAEWKILGGQTVTYGNPNLFSDQSKVDYISQEDLKKKIEQKEPLFILDAREKEIFAKGHLPGAYNIPLYEIERRRLELFSSKQIVVYSDIEIEAFQAAVKLYDTRFITAMILKDGFKKWTENNFEIEK